MNTTFKVAVEVLIKGEVEVELRDEGIFTRAIDLDVAIQTKGPKNIADEKDLALQIQMLSGAALIDSAALSTHEHIFKKGGQRVESFPVNPPPGPLS